MHGGRKGREAGRARSGGSDSRSGGSDARAGGSDARAALPGNPWARRGPALLGLFEEIAPSYDRLNRILSLGLDQRWRNWTVRTLRAAPPGPHLDLASGTGDLALIMSRRLDGFVIRADLSRDLLVQGGRKMERLAGRAGRRPGGMARSRTARGVAVACEMDRLPFRCGSLGSLAQGFALRHSRDHGGFFREISRVLKPGGRAAILDMRYPRKGIVPVLYRPYFRWVLPRLAAFLGGRRSAYEMMVESVRGLPPEEDLLALAREAGLVEVESRPGLMGAVRLITGRRP